MTKLIVWNKFVVVKTKFWWGYKQILCNKRRKTWLWRSQQINIVVIGVKLLLWLCEHILVFGALHIWQYSVCPLLVTSVKLKRCLDMRRRAGESSSLKEFPAKSPWTYQEMPHLMRIQCVRTKWQFLQVRFNLCRCKSKLLWHKSTW